VLKSDSLDRAGGKPVNLSICRTSKGIDKDIFKEKNARKKPHVFIIRIISICTKLFDFPWPVDEKLPYDFVKIGIKLIRQFLGWS
jgi:hypothetical protein